MEHKYHPGMEVHASKLQHFLFGISWKAKAIAQDIKYAVKLIHGIAGGYDGLQVRFGEEWEYIEWERTSSRSYDGSYKAGIKYDLLEKPYYVCVSWKNGTHTPLPILIEIDESEHEYSIQNAVVRFFFWLWDGKSLCPAAFRDAVTNCAHYEQQFNTTD